MIEYPFNKIWNYLLTLGQKLLGLDLAASIKTQLQANEFYSSQDLQILYWKIQPLMNIAICKQKGILQSIESQVTHIRKKGSKDSQIKNQPLS